MSTQQRPIQRQQHNQDIAKKLCSPLRPFALDRWKSSFTIQKWSRSNARKRSASLLISHTHLRERPMTTQRCCRA